MPTPLKLTLILSIFILSSFITTKTNNNFIGTFGVSAADPSQIKLSINADNTVTCQELSGLVSNWKAIEVKSI
jgi:hypothetical protein